MDHIKKNDNNNMEKINFVNGKKWCILILNSSNIKKIKLGEEKK